MPCSPVYEFHDVGICNFSQVAEELQRLGGGRSWNLMVVPFLGELEGGAFEKFAMQILEWKKEGHCLYLHGYRHKADLNLKRSLPGRLALRLTNSEAEFAGLSKNDLRMLLDKALQAWQKLNAGEAQGFVAPAWYGSNVLFNLCKELGFENYSSRFIIWNKSRGSRLSLPFSTAGLPKCVIPFVNFCEKIYLKIYSIFSFLPVPRVVKHPLPTP
jgi:predicted deacetylase